MPLLLVVAGILAGFVDSIAGGGGLITLPAIALVLGPGVDAIGTNKICGLTAALVALAVYARRGHMDWRSSVLFAVAVGTGGALGGRTAPLLPAWVFPVLLVVTCPLILWVVWRRELWVAREAASSGRRRRGHVVAAIVASGLACGFYDGVWGPGSGTFMFLALLFVAGLPLLPSLAAAKLANSASAATSLATFAAMGHVRPVTGLLVAAGTVAGGAVGAHQASGRAARIVRPVLVIVVLLLVAKLVTDAVAR